MVFFLAVLGNRHILMLYGSADPDPAIFVSDLEDGNKNIFFFYVFCLLLFEGTFTSFFNDKSHEEVTKQ
jgi:hypothetical protein